MPRTVHQHSHWRTQCDEGWSHRQGLEFAGIGETIGPDNIRSGSMKTCSRPHSNSVFHAAAPNVVWSNSLTNSCKFQTLPVRPAFIALSTPVRVLMHCAGHERRKNLSASRNPLPFWRHPPSSTQKADRSSTPRQLILVNVMISSVIQSLSWPEIRSSLWNSGYARMGRILVRAQCEELRSLYSDASLFRSRIDMERYRFGRGEYQYFANPLPAIVAELREKLYRFLAQAANEWTSALRIKADFPADLASFLRQCHRRGQKRPTPLLLRYKQ